MNLSQISQNCPAEPAVSAGWDAEIWLDDLLRDPLVRLVMDSDGVTERDMIVLFDQLRRSRQRADGCDQAG
jgi:hypothetical protein